MRSRIPLLCVDEAGEHDGIVDEEDGGVVADQVPVALLGVDFDGESARVADGVCRAALATDSRETDSQRSLLADLGEDGGAAVLGDVVGNLQVAEGACVDWLLGYLPIWIDLDINMRLQVMPECGQRLFCDGFPSSSVCSGFEKTN